MTPKIKSLAPAGAVTAKDVLQHAAAGDATAQLILAQVNQRVEGVNASDLRDLSASPLTEAEQLALAKVEYWTQALALEDDQAAFSYHMAELSTNEVRAIVGNTAWDKLFWDHLNGVPMPVAEDSYLPLQLRQWLVHQMRDIKAKFYANQELIDQKDKVAKAVGEHIPKLRKVYKKIAKERRNAVTRGKPGHIEEEDEDAEIL